MKTALQLLSIFERESDEQRRKLIAGKWFCLKKFFNELQESGDFNKVLGLCSSGQYILPADKNPIRFPGPIVFAGPEQSQRVDKVGNARSLAGGYGHIKDGRPALVFFFNKERWLELFPKYCGVWFSSLADSFAHEYTHYLDDVQQKGRLRGKGGSARLFDAGDSKGYFNNSDEINAFFAERRQDLWSWVRILKDMDLDPATKKQAMEHQLGKNFQEFTAKIFEGPLENLTPENRERVIKRAYAVWNSIQAEILK